ncbi:nicotinic acid mononucleotide adenyltransferase [Lutibacter sp.]|uniref:nicotinic acid mononucleotide adenyltransferase n=1 Tax=Lutibacter sp. TaxID=1925666 RepID=UPI003563EF8C
MKKIFFTLIVLFCTSFMYSQNNKLQKTEVKGDLTEVTFYYENGTIMQHGFYTKEGKLHASWESYNMDGSRKCIATYNYGVKVGVWTYFKDHKITKITYDNNKIIDIKEIINDKKVENNI